ncbi:MAG: hypothetical protein NTX48_10330 [Planctomycetales bacterium]|nr:hypothetical protein [Planctomycetales bacterium]
MTVELLVGRGSRNDYVSDMIRHLSTSIRPQSIICLLGATFDLQTEGSQQRR